MSYNNLSIIQNDFLRTQLYYLNNKQDDVEMIMKMKAFQYWLKYYEVSNQIRNELNERVQVINILKKSKRCQRRISEKEIISKYLNSYLFCIPKTLSSLELDVISNDIELTPTIVGRSILFLQGDYGDVYYMIAKGSVGLYIETDKYKEKQLEKNYGHLRSQHYKGSNEDVKGLGEKILTLQRGDGFGEYAILSTKHKVRSCSAVSLDEDSCIFILHAQVYNIILRQHHIQQKQLQIISFTKKSPLFRQLNICRSIEHVTTTTQPIISNTIEKSTHFTSSQKISVSTVLSPSTTSSSSSSKSWSPSSSPQSTPSSSPQSTPSPPSHKTLKTGFFKSPRKLSFY